MGLLITQRLHITSIYAQQLCNGKPIIVAVNYGVLNTLYILADSAADDGKPWWRHQMEPFSALLALCAGNSPVPVNSPHKGPVTRSFDVFFDLNKRLSNQPSGWWFETPP